MAKKKPTAEAVKDPIPEVAQEAETTLVAEVGAVPDAPAEEVSVPQEVGRLYKVTAMQGLNLRRDPGMEHPVLRVLPFDAVVEARGKSVQVNEASWLPVQDGWVAEAYLAPVEAEV